jgi:DNA-binding NarL/FixJ family response regulator
MEAIRTATRRRKAAELLRVVAATAGYASRQVADGLTPAQAAMATAEAAAELSAAADTLRRLSRLSLADRKRLAAEWTGAGLGKREIGRRLGVCERTVWRYLGH